MQGIKYTAAAMMVAGSFARPDADTRLEVEEWDTFVTDLGYDYDMYTVTSADDWELTLFRILPTAGTTLDAEYPPVLLQHGSMMDALSWL